MIKMTHSPSTSSLGSDFDSFLFVSIDADGNGKLLSVLSALARRDVDPWDQAAQLARLPVETATQILASLIAPLPGEPPAEADSLTISARLIALLPRRSGLEISRRNRFVGRRGAKTKIIMLWAVFMTLLVGFLIHLNWT